ncbi:Hypothetical protein, putative [Bodo saltans]|uniref:Uncharacterized protein n=1 Tax=Bodo saltans TaxID=75058 RepID=A0A0S4IJN5_BODSA|nr:Hypothetical protein, putative [Bodo saltans]|eukprot:CUE90176.1 Hypothetical protein, putative [Bodo saltans]
MGSGCSSDYSGGEHRSLEASGTVAHKLAPPNMTRRVSQSTFDRHQGTSSSSAVTTPLQQEGAAGSHRNEPSRGHSPRRGMSPVKGAAAGQHIAVNGLRRIGSLSPAVMNLPSQNLSNGVVGGKVFAGRSPTTSHQSLVVVPTSERADPWLDRTPLDQFEEECH